MSVPSRQAGVQGQQGPQLERHFKLLTVTNLTSYHVRKSKPICTHLLSFYTPVMEGAIRQADKPPSLDSVGRMENNNPSLLSFLLPDRFPILFDMLTGRRNQAFALLFPEFWRASSEILLLFFLELLLSVLSSGCLGCVSVYSNPPFPGRCRRSASSRNLRSEVQASLDRLSGPKCPSLPPSSLPLPLYSRPRSDQISFNLLPALASSPRETPKNAAAARGNLMAKLGP